MGLGGGCRTEPTSGGFAGSTAEHVLLPLRFMLGEEEKGGETGQQTLSRGRSVL